mmetsp:Transcript_20352/g.81371  ORF Transcript_20352/g.81371 Transcript_20352/m.81371 type:complete len:238 (+) Transcript_20352:444-1157(+)
MRSRSASSDAFWNTCHAVNGRSSSKARSIATRQSLALKASRKASSLARSSARRSRWRLSSLRVASAHTRTVPSAPAVATSVSPSCGEAVTATAQTRASSWALMTVSHVDVAGVHTRSAPSASPATSASESADAANARHRTEASWPSSVARHAPVPACHSLTVLSEDAVATVLRVNANATCHTPRAWPRSTQRSASVSAFSEEPGRCVTSHSLADLSCEHVATSVPVLLHATPLTSPE